MSADLYRHRVNRVIEIRLFPGQAGNGCGICEEEACRGHALSGSPERGVVVPFEPDRTRLQQLITYHMARAVLYDLLVTSHGSSVTMHHARNNVPPWLCEGSALYCAMGCGPDVAAGMSDRIEESPELFPRNRKVRDMAGYTMGRLFSLYCEEVFGHGMLGLLMHDMKASGHFMQSLETVTGKKSTVVEQDFRSFIQKYISSNDFKSTRQRPLVNTTKPGLIMRLPVACDSDGGKLLYTEHCIHSGGTAGFYSFNGEDEGSVITRDVKQDFLPVDAALQERNVALSADASITAWCDKTRNRHRVVIARASTGEIITEKAFPFRSIMDIAVSPSGDAAVFVGSTCSSADIYLYSWKDMHVQRLTDSAGVSRYPSFACNAGTVIFSSKDHRGGGKTYDLFSVDVKTRKVTLIYDSGGNDLQPVTGRQGDEIAFISDRDGMYEVYVLSRSDNRLCKIETNTPGACMPVYGPHGDSLFFSGIVNGVYRIFHISR